MNRTFALMIESNESDKDFSTCPFIYAGGDLYQMTRDIQFMSKIDFDEKDDIYVDINLVEYESRTQFYVERDLYSYIGRFRLNINKSELVRDINESNIVYNNLLIGDTYYNFSIQVYKHKVEDQDEYEYYLTLPMLNIVKMKNTN